MPLSTLRSASMTEAQRDAELTQLNGKLYRVAKAQFDKSCPAVAGQTVPSERSQLDATGHTKLYFAPSQTVNWSGEPFA